MTEYSTNRGNCDAVTLMNWPFTYERPMVPVDCAVSVVPQRRSVSVTAAIDWVVVGLLDRTETAPTGPVIPIAPVAPVAPVPTVPVGPVRPIPPVTPVVPVVPVEPVTPVVPVAPVVPVCPV